jgi:hypothetical protein
MIDEKAKEALRNQIKICLEESLQTSDKSKELKDANYMFTEDKLTNLKYASIYTHLSISYKTHIVSLSLIYAILDKIETISTTDDLQNLKKELSQKVESTLAPIAEEIQRQKDIEENAKDIYR